MKNLISQLNNSVRKFHNDEEGFEVLQVVLIVALAAIAGVAVYNFGGQAKDWCQAQIDTLFGKTDFDVPDGWDG